MIDALPVHRVPASGLSRSIPRAVDVQRPRVHVVLPDRFVELDDVGHGDVIALAGHDEHVWFVEADGAWTRLRALELSARGREHVELARRACALAGGALPDPVDEAPPAIRWPKFFAHLGLRIDAPGAAARPLDDRARFRSTTLTVVETKP